MKSMYGPDGSRWLKGSSKSFLVSLIHGNLGTVINSSSDSGPDKSRCKATSRRSAMKGRLALVVKMVTEMLRFARSWARWSSGMVWPLDMKGNKTK
ncbi:hypothetical protein LXL04_013297 [Taraxacum kok-saghyz]